MIEQLNEPISSLLVLPQFELLGPFRENPLVPFDDSYPTFKLLLTRFYLVCLFPLIIFLLFYKLPGSLKLKPRLIDSSLLLPHSLFESDDNFILKLAKGELSFSPVAKMEETSPASLSHCPWRKYLIL